MIITIFAYCIVSKMLCFFFSMKRKCCCLQVYCSLPCLHDDAQTGSQCFFRPTASESTLQSPVMRQQWNDRTNNTCIEIENAKKKVGITLTWDRFTKTPGKQSLKRQKYTKNLRVHKLGMTYEQTWKNNLSTQQFNLSNNLSQKRNRSISVKFV